MPELAEVEHYRRRWAVAVGERVERVFLNAEKRVFRGVDTAALVTGLAGERMVEARAHGKQMYYRFGERQWLGVHLGMTGKLFCVEPEAAGEKHDHLRLVLDSGRVLVFQDSRMFGRVLYAACEGLPEWLQGLPPEVLSDAFTFEQMDAFLDCRAGAPIKAVLLMQGVFPGVGNWMADEILWRARVAPMVPAGRIGRRKRREIFACLQAVCRDAMRVIAPDWSRPPEDWLFNHRWRDGGICPRTGRALRRESIGGRTTCWSPAWQCYRG
ncbi:MAG: Fpg/Nei family DNA glycosylase [Coraliomargarita sp. TMED73]|jgi:formamidopyrimidine-DNA glycosylase|nr:MAG: Fpg/Nei family DNA glycosylase [Coraliomargarita sp. TMED73]